MYQNIKDINLDSKQKTNKKSDQEDEDGLNIVDDIKNVSQDSEIIPFLIYLSFLTAYLVKALNKYEKFITIL